MGPAAALHLREMTAADLPEVARLERELFGGEAWSAQLLASELEASQDRPEGPADRCYVVAEQDDDAAHPTLLGYAGLWFGDGRGDADLLSIATLPAARRRGVARTMLHELIRVARAAGCAAVLLEVRASNEAAQALYRSEGFERIGIRKRYYTAPVEDAIVMRLELRALVGPVGAEAIRGA